MVGTTGGDLVTETIPAANSALEAHGCLHAAVITWAGRRTWYPCRSHKGGVHRFLARLDDSCPAPWCRLPAGHLELHEIPPGRVEIHDAIGVEDDD